MRTSTQAVADATIEDGVELHPPTRQDHPPHTAKKGRGRRAYQNVIDDDENEPAARPQADEEGIAIPALKAPQPANDARSAYRPDVDGLRAVAVLAVVTYHLDHRYLPGGFVGVDIFFVISGYVVSLSVWPRRRCTYTSL